MRREVSDLFAGGSILPVPVEVLFVAVLGAMLGSFATALTYRGTQGIAWYRRGDRSFCPHCRAPLSLRDLLPLLSWLSLKGRCRHCGASIPSLYPVTELGLMALCLVYYALYGLSSPGVVFPIFLALPFLWALTIIDLRTKTLPDSLVLALAVLGFFRLLFLVWEGSGALWPALNAVSGGLIFGGVSWAAGGLVGRLTGKAALGFGDVKFFAAAGIWLGPSALAGFCIVAGGAGIILGLLWRKMTGEERFPFGPALIFSFCVLLALDSPLFAG